MRYIQNEELREWIKDNLRKTIFQKAHALSIQTGCEILIKLHDIRSQEDTHQYYATGDLHKAYSCNTLHKHPKDKLVSGETGLPQCQYITTGVQSGDDDSTADTDHDANNVLADESFKTEQQQQYVTNDENEETPLPLHLTLSSETSASVNDAILSDGDKVDQGGDQEQSPMEVKVKIEKLDDEMQDSAVTGEISNTNVQHLESASFTGFQQPESMDSLTGAGLSLQGESQTMGRYSMPMSPKPYQCGICGKAFRSVQILQKHTRTFHFRPQSSSPGQMVSRGMAGSTRDRNQTTHMKRYQCVMCNRSFPSPDLLTDHMSRSHMNTQSGASQSSALTFAATNSSAPSTATAPFTAVNKQGPFHITESSTIVDQSQPSTSTAPLRHGPSWPIAPSSFISQKKRAMSGPTFRTPRVGRPMGALGSSPKGQGTPPKAKAAHKPSKATLKPSLPPDTQSFVHAILTMPGPVTTYRAFQRSKRSAMKFRNTTSEHYEAVVEYLASKKQFGKIVTIESENHRKTAVYVKPNPNDVSDADLKLASEDAVCAEEYLARYNWKHDAHAITWVMKNILYKQGHVPVGSFH